MFPFCLLDSTLAVKFIYVVATAVFFSDVTSPLGLPKSTEDQKFSRNPPGLQCHIETAETFI